MIIKFNLQHIIIYMSKSEMTSIYCSSIYDQNSLNYIKTFTFLYFDIMSSVDSLNLQSKLQNYLL